MVNLTIDNINVSVPEGTTIMDASNSETLLFKRNQ